MLGAAFPTFCMQRVRHASQRARDRLATHDQPLKFSCVPNNVTMSHPAPDPNSGSGGGIRSKRPFHGAS